MWVSESDPLLFTPVYILMIVWVFQSAWHNAPFLQCFGSGQNVVPTIHIKDLAA